MSTISLTTDFGHKDWYVGVMKGVIYNIYPNARMADITHDIESHSVEQAAFVLASSFSFFSYGSIHVAVVDPGVGTSRAPILLESRGHYFIGPDNGIFTLVDHPTSVTYALDKKEYWLSPVSDTFHGRDIFAPVAAYLARGVPSDQLGTRRKEGIAKIEIPKAQAAADGSIQARILHVDKFGNCVTNISKGQLPVNGAAKTLRIQAGGSVVNGVVANHYEQNNKEQALVVSGSTGYWELCMPQAPFAQRYKVRRGDAVTLSFA